MVVILDQKLVMHAVVLRAPVLRQVSIPEVERRDRCPVPRLVDRWFTRAQRESPYLYSNYTTLFMFFIGSMLAISLKES